MRAFIFLTSLLLCRSTRAQSPSDVLADIPLMCQSGYTPSLSCEPKPVDDNCACTCRDGAVFNQTRPDFLGSVPITPGLGDNRQIEGKPCTEEIIQPWTKIALPHKAHTLEPTDVVSNVVDIPEDSIFLVADADKRCQHFEVYIDDELVGETFGEGPLDDSNCGTGEECMEQHGGSHGYFTLSKGQHKIGLRWVKVTDACKYYKTGVGAFQIYKPCQ